jgi:predicted Rossmann fold flavoprotein
MQYDVIIVGAGAAGLMCAMQAGARGKRVLLLDHAKKPAEKIRISGGGRCNFTNIHTTSEHFLSENPRFCISALSRYQPQNFIELLEKHSITYHEKTLGQLFCDGSAMQIIQMLLAECAAVNVVVQLETSVQKITRADPKNEGETRFSIQTSKGDYTCESLVIATGGKSIPKMGATGFGYDIARQFGLNIITPRAALVPVIFTGAMLNYVKNIAGLALDVSLKSNGKIFKEAMLFTHRGLSGPAILQISSYWKMGDSITINLAPNHDILSLLLQARKENAKQKPLSILSKILPKRLAACICEQPFYSVKLAEISNKNLQKLADEVNAWVITPSGSEGFRTAEVTLGGVDTSALSSANCETKSVPGLYFIGEVIDVTGHLGGFNFQWAWASGYIAGQAV